MRRAIAEHMAAAHREAAAYTYVEEVDFTEISALRRRLEPAADQAGTHLTYLPLVLAAVSLALKEHPRLNATVDPHTGDLLVHRAQHVAVAVHTGEGLIVPVVRHVEARGVLELAREIERLTVAARGGRLTREDVTGGTFSVTSLGPLGGLLATPILNTPQVAILGVHRIAPRPVVREGEIVARDMANLSLTLDHRYVDGYAGAAFVQTLKGHLEAPAAMEGQA
jgi:pyruvate/2-oxoglutarate dehydrogenase complex dihydrolipoamide acyltransferase (E2) component